MPTVTISNRLKTCGTCAYRKTHVCVSMKLVRACNIISQNPERINAVTLATLIVETEALSSRKYKCVKEPNAWTHLMDRACAFWQPSDDCDTVNCLNVDK